MVWPSLVVVEAVSATVFLMILTLLSIFISAPLTEHANTGETPNPSKAPWYFLNLQELLLHMNAGLAGVIVPTLALGAIAAIPYFDRSPLGVGILGTSAKGRKIIGFTTVFTTVVLSAMIVLDEIITPKRTGWGIGNWLKEQGGSEFVYNTLPVRGYGGDDRGTRQEDRHDALQANSARARDRPLHRFLRRVLGTDDLRHVVPRRRSGSCLAMESPAHASLTR